MPRVLPCMSQIITVLLRAPMVSKGNQTGKMICDLRL